MGTIHWQESSKIKLKGVKEEKQITLIGGGKMANEQNLISFNEMEEEKAKKIQSMGGKARAMKEQRKKTMREQAQLLLSLAVTNPKIKDKMNELGIEENEQNNQMAMIISMLNTTLKGSSASISAYNSLQATIGEAPKIEQVNIDGGNIEEYVKKIEDKNEY